MSYEGGRLAPWFDTSPNEKACRRMAARGAHELTKRTTAHTPTDSGHLKASWKDKPVVIVVDALGHTVYESGTETDVDYAPYVEHGTGLWGPKHSKYLIEPKTPGGVLHWLGPGGESVFARRVMHPGSPGAHMVAIAVAEVEVALPLLMEIELTLWAHEVEHQNHTGLGHSA